LLAAWRRWANKRPHNRVKVRRLPDGAGGTDQVKEPWPEPVVPAVYREICEGAHDVVSEFQRARHGVPRDEVCPLLIPLTVLQRWVAQLDGAANE
jgi:hypothetical protein